MKKVMTGNEAVAHAVALADVGVIPAYPITPQTTIIETIADKVASGEMKAEYMRVESEHSAMAACIGASAAGVRTFTATSSQGLALMHEMLHWAALARMPIVMADVNRAMAPGWNIWTDQNDSLSQRDTGWIQYYCRDGQQVFDTVLTAFRLAEKVRLPVMVVLDAFFLSHTTEAIDIPDAKAVTKFLPQWNPDEKLDPKDPHTFGGMVGPDLYMEFRLKMQQGMDEALLVHEEVARDFEKRFGRYHPMVETYRTDDEPELTFVTTGTAASTCEVAVDILRERGIRAANVTIHMFRPFPKAALEKALAGSGRIAVVDRNVSPGHHGIFFEEIKSALFGDDRFKNMYGYIAGLGGRDITVDTFYDIASRARRCETPGSTEWIGVQA